MKVWKFYPGYVNIGMVGKYPERLVNRCIEQGVMLRSIERRSEGFSAAVRAEDFKRLRPLARGCGVRVRILSKHGSPRVLAALKRDLVFAIAVCLLALIICAASTRLWFIRIETVSIPESEIAERLGELGVRVGAPRTSVSTSVLSRELGKDTRIVNAKAVLRGVTLTVTVTETNASLPKDPAEPAGGIYADKDCVIRFISVSKGRAQVKDGQAVREGDLLIIGDPVGTEEDSGLHAEGLVMGEVSYSASATASRTVIKSVRSGNTATVLSAEIFGMELMLGRPFDEYELEPVGTGRLTASALPVVIKKYVCHELVKRAAEDSDEGTETRARLMAQEGLSAILPRDASVFSIVTSCSVNADGSVTAVISAAAVERIGSRREN